MKSIFSFIILVAFLSCEEATNSNSAPAANNPEKVKDTVIVAHKNELDPSYEGFLSKSYFYKWVAGSDTLNFTLVATEHQKDSSLHLHIIHKQPILFSTALKRIAGCMKIIKEDFYVSKLSSLNIGPPVYYADLSIELSKEYEQRFGRKTVGHQQLDQFLLSSHFTSNLNTFLKPFGKTVSHYGIEKFQLIKKENQSHHLQDADLLNYPDFIIDGLGLSIRLTTAE